MDGTPGPERGGVGTDVERVVRCRGCGHPLTPSSTERAGEGGHAPTFVNPDGVAFTIRLFHRADGTRCHGVPQAKSSWFPGTAWVFASCGGCGRQVGWRYSGVDDFFGLIADRIADA